MKVEFQGLELETPLGGISIGRGYSRVAGEDYFRGLAVRLPFGRILVGWHVWEEDEALTEPQASHLFARHLVIAVVVWITAIILNWSLDLSGQYIKWLISIWGAVLALHLLQALGLWVVDRAVDRLSAVSKSVFERLRH